MRQSSLEEPSRCTSSAPWSLRSWRILSATASIWGWLETLATTRYSAKVVFAATERTTTSSAFLSSAARAAMIASSLKRRVPRSVIEGILLLLLHPRLLLFQARPVQLFLAVGHVLECGADEMGH